MKKIFATLFSFILFFSAFLTSTSYAATNLPVVPSDAKATITIEKTAEQGEGTLKAGTAEIDIPLGQYVKHVGEINFYLEEQNGVRNYLDYENLEYQSTDTDIFTVTDGYLHGIKYGTANLVVTYNNQTVNVKVNVIEKTDLTLKFENTHDAYYTNLYMLRFKSFGDYYEHMSIRSNFDYSKKELKISGIDWSKKGPYIALVVFGNHIYKIEVNETQRGKVVTIPYNKDDFTKVNFKMPGNSKIESIGVGLKDNNREIYSLSTSGQFNEYFIAHGNYGFQLTGSDNKSIYTGYVNNINLTGVEQTIEIPQQQFSKVDFSLNFKNGATIDNVRLCNSSIVNICGSHLINSKEFYLKNDTYNNSVVSVNLNEYKYEFDLGNLSVLSPTVLEIDDKLTSELKIEANRTFAGGSKLNLNHYENATNYLVVRNAKGTKLNSIYDKNYNEQSGKFVFKRGSEIYVVPATGSSVKLPNVSGTFEVTYTFGEVDTTPNKKRPDVSGTWKSWLNTKGVVDNKHPWTITLNKPVNGNTVTTENVFVLDSEGYLVEGVSLNASNDKISVIAPPNGYESNKTYTLYIRDSVSNTDGVNLKENTKMEFSTK